MEDAIPEEPDPGSSSNSRLDEVNHASAAAAAAAAFQKLDADGDGIISYAEWLQGSSLSPTANLLKLEEGSHPTRTRPGVENRHTSSSGHGDKGQGDEEDALAMLRSYMLDDNPETSTERFGLLATILGGARGIHPTE